MKTIFLIALFLHGISAGAQQKLELEVGKPFSYSDNKELNALLEAEKKGRNRKVIIDMFSSTCPTCFKSMPEIQAYQDKYGDSLYFILMGKRDKDIVKIYERFRDKFSLSMPVVFDSVYFKKYHYAQLPNYLWLDKKGTTIAETVSEELGNNIPRVAAGLPLQLNTERVYAFNPSKLLMMDDNGWSDTGFLYRSVLSRWNYRQDLHYPNKLGFSKNGPYFQILGIMEDGLFNLAYVGKSYWDFRDPEYTQFYEYPIRIGGWAADSTWQYSYSFATKSENKDSFLLQRALQNDLATYFGYEVRIEKMQVPCWKLIALPGAHELLRSKSKRKGFEGTFTHIVGHQVPMLEVLGLMGFADKKADPIFDETGINFPVDIVIDAVPYDWDSMIEAFRRNRLDLVRGEALMKVILLEKK